ncbi:hypothetical protein QQP08_022993 [Theobroma cacao]|nr:hypothetical protein QQP08_022993 [Theobroma cacao]
MASTYIRVLLIISMLLLTLSSAQADHTSFQLMTEETEWPWTMSVYDELGANEEEEVRARTKEWKLWNSKFKNNLSTTTLQPNLARSKSNDP